MTGTGTGGREPEGVASAPPGDEDLAAELQRVLLVTSRILRSHTADGDVSASQFSVLAYLHRTGESTPGALSAFEHVSPPVMTRLLGRLEEMGLLRRTAHPRDGRQVLVHLTPAGREVVLRGRAERDRWLRGRLESVGPDEREVLQRATAILRRELIGRDPSRSAAVVGIGPGTSEVPRVPGSPEYRDSPGEPDPS